MRCSFMMTAVCLVSRVTVDAHESSSYWNSIMGQEHDSTRTRPTTISVLAPTGLDPGASTLTHVKRTATGSTLDDEVPCDNVTQKVSSPVTGARVVPDTTNSVGQKLTVKTPNVAETVPPAVKKVVYPADSRVTDNKPNVTETVASVYKTVIDTVADTAASPPATTPSTTTLIPALISTTLAPTTATLTNDIAGHIVNRTTGVETPSAMPLGTIAPTTIGIDTTEQSSLHNEKDEIESFLATSQSSADETDLDLDISISESKEATSVGNNSDSNDSNSEDSEDSEDSDSEDSDSKVRDTGDDTVPPRKSSLLSNDVAKKPLATTSPVTKTTKREDFASIASDAVDRNVGLRSEKTGFTFTSPSPAFKPAAMKGSSVDDIFESEPKKTTLRPEHSAPAVVPFQTVSQLPTQTISQVSVRTVPQVPALTDPHVPVRAVPQVPAPSVLQVPALTVPKMPASPVTQVPDLTAPKVPAPPVPQVPNHTAPHVPARPVPKMPASTVSKMPAPPVTQLPDLAAPKVPAPVLQVPSTIVPQVPVRTDAKEPVRTDPTKVPATTYPQVPATTYPQVPVPPQQVEAATSPPPSITSDSGLESVEAQAQRAAAVSGEKTNASSLLLVAVAGFGCMAIIAIVAFMKKPNHETDETMGPDGERNSTTTATEACNFEGSVANDPLGTRYSSIVMITPNGDGMCIL